jgi:magnesium/cobalt transport protein CorA
MELNAYLYDAVGNDEKIEIEDIDIKKLGKSKLLWIDLGTRNEEMLNSVAAALDLENVPFGSILKEKRRPKIDKFESFFQFCVDSAVTKKKAPFEKVSIDFIVGKNFVVTIHDGEVDYFREFRKREKGETTFGELDAESFVATLLDMHIVSYFRALEELELEVDELDEAVLEAEMETEKFLAKMGKLRRSVSLLRRWLMPHRDVIYSLSRADFQQIAESDSLEQYKMLNTHFENAVDAIESSRDTVLSTFELYATRSAHMMNIFIQRLTFLTVLIGSLGVVAGILGMNYKVDFFESSSGFWLTIAGMTVVAIGLTVLGRVKRWI